jgi:serine/threonine-protein kinase
MANLTLVPKLSEMSYRVLNVLGTGAGSTILLITDKEVGGRKFALKVVKRQDADDDIYLAQARTEFEVAQRLNHDSIIKIYDMRVKKSWFRVTGVELLMEYVDGHTLDEFEAPALGELVLIFNFVAAALGHMHRRGVYHGDLKPSNIMLSTEGLVKLIDFGTAWIKGEEKNRVQVALHDQRVGGVVLHGLLAFVEQAGKVKPWPSTGGATPSGSRPAPAPVCAPW